MFCAVLQNAFCNYGVDFVLLTHRRFGAYAYIIQGDQKRLCTCFLYCNHQVHIDFLITLYIRMYDIIIIIIIIIYLLQLGCYPVAVVILHVNKT
jgi:hypothetical protein